MESATETSLRNSLAEKQADVDAQANAVRELKAASATKVAIDEAVKALNSFKLNKSSFEKQLQAAIAGNGNGTGAVVSREAFKQNVIDTLERMLFYIPSFILESKSL